MDSAHSRTDVQFLFFDQSTDMMAFGYFAERGGKAAPRWVLHSYKKLLVKSLYDFCCLTDMAMIAEGIETESELRALIDIGVHYGQGYFIQYPQSDISEIEPHVLDSIRASNAQKNHHFRAVTSFYIGNLCGEGITASPQDLAGEVYDAFLRDENLMGITVVNEKKRSWES